MSEHAVAAQESHKATGCTDCVQPVFVWILKCSGKPCSPVRVHTKLKHNIYYIKEYVGKQKDRKIAFSTLN